MIQTYFIPNMRKIYSTTLTAASANIEMSYAYKNNKTYLIVCRIVGAGGGNGNLSLYANTDTTATNYYNQYLSVSHNVVGGGRANTALVGGTIDAVNSVLICKVSKDYANHIHALCEQTYNNAANVTMLQEYLQSVTTFATLTKLTLNNSRADGFGVGTNVIVYEMD